MTIDQVAIETTDDTGVRFETRLWMENGAYKGEHINLDVVRTVGGVEATDYKALIQWLYGRCGFDRPFAVVFATSALQLLGMGG